MVVAVVDLANSSKISVVSFKCSSTFKSFSSIRFLFRMRNDILLRAKECASCHRIWQKNPKPTDTSRNSRSNTRKSAVKPDPNWREITSSSSSSVSRVLSANDSLKKLINYQKITSFTYKSKISPFKTFKSFTRISLSGMRRVDRKFL